MADRRVRQTGKDPDGDITALCDPGEFWSPRLKDDAIGDIERGLYTYFVEQGGNRTDVRVVEGPNGGKHLRTDPDPISANNLDKLPDC